MVPLASQRDSSKFCWQSTSMNLAKVHPLQGGLLHPSTGREVRTVFQIRSFLGALPQH